MMKVMDDYPSYMMGRATRMTSMMWNLTRVTAREEIISENEATENILDKELSNLWYEVVVMLYQIQPIVSVN